MESLALPVLQEQTGKSTTYTTPLTAPSSAARPLKAKVTDPAVKLTPQAWIPISVAVSAVIAFAGVAVWIQTRLQGLEFSHRELQLTMDSMKGEISMLKDRWTGRDMSQWAEILQARNPTLVVPSVPR